MPEQDLDSLERFKERHAHKVLGFLSIASGLLSAWSFSSVGGRDGVQLGIVAAFTAVATAVGSITTYKIKNNPQVAENDPTRRGP